MGAGGNTDFIVNFKAQVKDLRKEIQGLKQFNQQQQKSSKQSASVDQRRERERQKSTKQRFQVEDKARKTERAHIQFMTREESKRHRASLGQIQTQGKAQEKLVRENERLKKRVAQAGGGGNTGKKAFAGGMTGAAIGTAAARAGMGLWNFFVGGVQAGYQNYVQYGQAKGRTAGLGSGRAINRGISGAMGSKLGFSKIDTASMVPSMGRATGELGPREMQQAMRATGQGEGEVADVFSTIRRAGFDFTGAGPKKQSAGGRQFQQLIAGGMASGLERARLPEYFQGVQKIADEQRNINTGVISIKDIAKQLTMLGQSGRPGMQGAAGVSILEKFNGALQRPGGGEFGENFIRQAMGFGKPGGNTSYYDAEKMREEGITGKAGAGNIQRIMTELRKQFGTGHESNLALREVAGTSLDQGEQLNKIYNGPGSTEEKLAKIEEVMKASEPIEKQSLDLMKGVGGTLSRIAGKTDAMLGLGAKYAADIEKMENLQLAALLKISDGVEAIRKFFMGSKDVKDAAKSLANDPKNDFTHRTASGAVSDINAVLEREMDAASKTKGGTGWSGAYQSAQDWFTDDTTGEKRKLLSAEAAKRMMRLDREKNAINYLQSNLGDKFDPMNPVANKYIKDYGAGSDSYFPAYVPDSMLARHRASTKKKTESGTVTPTPAADADASGTDASTDSSDDADRSLAVTIHHQTDDARDKPTSTIQKPGVDSKKAQR